MAETEVSESMWNQVMEGARDTTKDNPPVRANYAQALSFIAKLNQLEPNNHYRLPTEAE